MKALKKQKKITVKFFLNQLLEPATNEKNQKYYPLYIQVTYNRKNMQLKSKYGLYYKKLKDVQPELMEFEEKVLRKIIMHEAAQTLNDYELKGLKRKFEVYSLSLMYALECYLKPMLKRAITKTNDELTTVLDFGSVYASVVRLYKAACLLFKDFDRYIPAKLQEELTAYWDYQKLYPEPNFDFTFPVIIDWLNGSYQAELEKKLKAVYKNKPEVVKKVLTLIDQAVSENSSKIQMN